MFRIHTNILALIANRHLNTAAAQVAVHLERLSSGLRINRAGDDPAGLSAAEALRSQLAGQKTSTQNIARAITLLQTADGALEQIGSIMARLKELATQAADDTFSASNRSAISTEAAALINEIERIAQSTTFNGIQLLATSGSTGFTFFVGDGTLWSPIAAQRLGVAIAGVNFSAAGVGTMGGSSLAITLADFMTRASAEALVQVADRGVGLVAQARTGIGAFQNRLEYAQSNLSVAILNATAAESTIRDADFAAEIAALTRAQILTQAAASMLRLAQVMPLTMLRLFA